MQNPQKLLLFTYLAIVLLSCDNTTTEDVAGLWQLEAIDIDGYVKEVKPVFIDLKEDNRFAVSQITGDLVGIYSLEDQLLQLKSNDRKWFNTSWKLEYFQDHFILHGKKTPYKTTHLRFKKIDKIPRFDGFANEITGKWQLYKIRRKNEIESVSGTWFNISEDGSYHISGNEGVLEYGRAIINTRHHKIIFEHDETIWDAWFYGRELRLENQQVGIQYSLRKPI